MVEILAFPPERASILKKELGSEYKYYEAIRDITTQQGIQARMPYEIDIY